MESTVDDQSMSVLWLLLSLAISALALLLGAMWVGLPGILRELWRCIGDWAQVHENSRDVDCRPWGLERSFTIAQGFSEKEPAMSFPFGRTGLSLWNGGVGLAKHLTEQRDTLSSGAFAAGKSIIEVGCGQGLVSMIVTELFPDVRKVVSTDGSEDVLRSAQENMTANMGDDHRQIELALLRWEHAPDVEQALALNNGAGYDVVLGSDLTYLEDHGPLISTILQLAHANTEVWLTHEPRRRSTDALKTSLCAAFRSVVEFNMELTLAETGRDVVPIVGWHCVGKLPK